MLFASVCSSQYEATTIGLHKPVLVLSAPHELQWLDIPAINYPITDLGQEVLTHCGRSELGK